MHKELLNTPLPYLTTPYLLTIFSNYKHPRDKIKNMLAQGELLHIKQGLYLLGKDYGRQYSKEVLAGMIYGPSAISFEYALSYHGLIPERVETVTSICFKRNKSYETPVGKFIYKYISTDLYPIGVEYVETANGNFFIARPEKALCDMAYFAKFQSDEEALEYVLNGLRIDESEFKKLNPSLLLQIKKRYKRQSTSHLVDAIIHQQGEED